MDEAHSVQRTEPFNYEQANKDAPGAGTDGQGMEYVLGNALHPASIFAPLSKVADPDLVDDEADRLHKSPRTLSRF